jgi:hypothetical protein
LLSLAGAAQLAPAPERDEQNEDRLAAFERHQQTDTANDGRQKALQMEIRTQHPEKSGLSHRKAL